MSDLYHVVTFAGPFGYIKPWTAVRDDLTYSQPFLTPSIVEGMRQRLEVSAILRHRLAHAGLSTQQEQVQSAGFAGMGRGAERVLTRPRSVINRGFLLSPTLHLAFPTAEDAAQAAYQHLCLCRNEDLVFPTEVRGQLVREMTPDAFNELDGFELLFEDGPDSFLVGYSRYEDGAPMYGRLLVVGNATGVEEPLVR